MSKIHGIIEIHLARMSDGTQRTYRPIFDEWITFTASEYRFFTPDYEMVMDFIGYLRGKMGREGRHSKSLQFTWVTVAKYTWALRGLYKRLLARGMVKCNPFCDPDFSFKELKEKELKRVTISFPEDRILDMIEAPGLDTRIGIKDTALMALLFYAGLRSNEVVTLKMRDIQKTEKGSYFVYLEHTKAQKQAKHRLPDEAMEYIIPCLGMRRFEGAKPEDYIFASLTGGHMNRRTLHDKFKTYCEKIGVNSLLYSAHSARFAAVAKLLNDGVPPIDIKDFSRHASVKMVEYYDRRIREIDDAPHAKMSYKKNAG